jgi:hypothetical protein
MRTVCHGPNDRTFVSVLSRLRPRTAGRDCEDRGSEQNYKQCRQGGDDTPANGRNQNYLSETEKIRMVGFGKGEFYTGTRGRILKVHEFPRHFSPSVFLR